MPLFALAACLGGPALAQEVSPDLRDRTGPQAEIETPAFPDAPQRLFKPPEATPLPAVSGSALFATVEVDASREAPAATRRDWEPAKDAATGLELARGAALDAAWVREQFVHNGMVGKPVPLDRLVALVQLINRAFIANGYINSGVLAVGAPPSDGGVLRLRLVSGEIAADDGSSGFEIVWAEGRSRGLEENFVRDRMPAAQAIPLNALDVERQFRQLIEDPAIRTVDANLQPGTRPGEAQLTLTIEPAPQFDFYLNAANNRSPSIGGERFSAGTSMRNLLADGDILSVEGGITGKQGDGIASYEVPLFDPLTTLLVRGGYNEAAVTDPQLRPLGITATDWHVEAGVTRHLVRRPLLPGRLAEQWKAARTVTLGLRFAHHNSKTFLFGQPFSFSPGSVDGRSQYSALRLAADWIERGTNMVFAISLTATQGLDGTRSNISGVLSPTTDFRIIRAQASLARRITGQGLELRVRVGGQWADGVLYSGERFSAGGAQTVRGYRETLLLADTGFNGTLELAQPFRFARARGAFDWSAFVASAFLDGAMLYNRQGPQNMPSEIASIGASLSWTPSLAITARVTYGLALRASPITNSRDLQDRGVHFGVTLRPQEF